MGAAAPERGRTVELAGWGHAGSAHAEVLRPEALARLQAAVQQGNGIARGHGRSYGDAAMSAGRVYDISRLSRLLEFRDGVLTAEAGATLGDIARTFLARGWWLPVSPDTQHVTLGGAIAADVHGRNHHVAGAFGSHVEAVRLLCADGEMRWIGPDRDPELFWATVGGMGLTGVIVEAKLRLVPAQTGYLSVDYGRTPGLAETLGWFAGQGGRYPYAAAWIDSLATGRGLGRAVVVGARPLLRSELSPLDDAFPPPRAPLPLPFHLPSGILSRGVAVALNAAYYARRRPQSGRREALWRFFYPLDSLGDWYRLYGRRGFAQFQAVFPPGVGEPELRDLIGRVQRARHANFACGLRRMGSSDQGLLSFPRAGLALSFDLPIQGVHTKALFDELYDLTADLGGRVNLSTDIFLTPARFRRMYPHWEEFLRRKALVDPDMRFHSSLSDRLGMGVSD